MGTRPRTKFVMELKSRRCPKCGGKLNNQQKRCRAIAVPPSRKDDRRNRWQDAALRRSGRRLRSDDRLAEAAGQRRAFLSAVLPARGRRQRRRRGLRHGASRRHVPLLAAPRGRLRREPADDRPRAKQFRRAGRAELAGAELRPAHRAGRALRRRGVRGQFAGPGGHAAAARRAVAEMLAAVRPGGAVVVQVLNLWRLPDGPCVWQKRRRAKLPRAKR